MIDACISPKWVKCAAVTYSAIVSREAFELEMFSDSTRQGGSATASLLSIVHFSLVCQVSSHYKDRKGVLHSKHAYFSAYNLFPIPIKCSIYMNL